MNLRPGYKKEEDVEINLTALIDVVFLLLIFFMVSTTFDRHANLKVQLPESSNQAEQSSEPPLVLTIDAKGKYYINERQVVNTSLDTLKSALQQTVADKKDVAIMLRADANTPHQAVVRAMDAAAQLGLTRISIATVESQ
ncbi:MAG: biopolymer transporter ExbD [Gammaproteobacteria bacterium]